MPAVKVKIARRRGINTTEQGIAYPIWSARDFIRR
jgi:hypothetical protein